MAEIWTIDGGSRQVAATYQPVINCHHVRQATAIKVVHESPALKAHHLDIPNEVKALEEHKLLPPKKTIRCKSYPRHPRKSKEKDQEKIEVTNKRTKVVFRFIYHPEYLELGSTVVIADGTLHAFGKITKILYDV
eukprot:TRINITY_DN3616_c0_g4_i1.p4 TRINITY_DN3616_c0_g4~~TRINITY_DN3616_c0_g4_i1.p4  ORF type:complete len:135 (+),score=30.96 TRINITY_DN3616_c0_g4_i1:1294-1698(+)